jgi:hypothetical protein
MSNLAQRQVRVELEAGVQENNWPGCQSGRISGIKMKQWSNNYQCHGKYTVVSMCLCHARAAAQRSE